MEKHEQDRKAQEDEPLEEKDAEGCQVTTDECEFAPAERDGTAPDAEFSLREEIFETFKPVTEILVESPIDGMPIPANERSDLARAHPFTRETVVCVEDDTLFVELFEDELEARGWSRGGRDGLWFPDSTDLKFGTQALGRYDENGEPRSRRQFSPFEVQTKFGKSVAKFGDELVPVRMRRERCRFWMRQVMANDDQPEPTEPGHLIRYSNCAARRSVGGALMSMRDEAMYACDYRDPYDPETAEKYLDKFDRNRLNGRKHLEMIRPFNLAK